MHYVPCSATAPLTPGFAQTRKAGLIAAVLSLIYGRSGVKKKCANKSWHHESPWPGSHGLNGSKSSPKMLHWKKKKKKKCMYIYVFKNKKQNVYGAELTQGSHVETCFHQHSLSGSNSSPIHISARLEEKK